MKAKYEVMIPKYQCFVNASSTNPHTYILKRQSSINWPSYPRLELIEVLRIRSSRFVSAIRISHPTLYAFRLSVKSAFVIALILISLFAQPRESCMRV